MADTEYLEQIVARLFSGKITEAERRTLIQAIRNGDATAINLASGERTVAIGGNVTHSNFVTGDNNLILQLSGDDASIQAKLLEILFPSAAVLPISFQSPVTGVQSASPAVQSNNLTSSSSEEQAAKLLNAMERLTERLDTHGILEKTVPESPEPAAQRQRRQDMGPPLLDTLKRRLSELEHEKAWEIAGQLHDWASEFGPQMPEEFISDIFATLAECEVVRAKVAAQTGEIFEGSRVRYFLTEVKTFLKAADPVAGTSLELRVTSLEAYLVALEGDPDGGLALLQDRADPFSIRRCLAIFLDAERFPQAAEIVRDIPLDEEWCDKAIIAFMRSGETPAMAEALRWVRERDDATLARRCQVLASQAGLIYAFRHRSGEVVLPGRISEQEARDLRDALDIIESLTRSLHTELRLRTELEALAVQTALHIYLFLGERAEAVALTSLLATRSPIPLFVADLALDYGLAPPADLPSRLREERPGEFRAQLLALLVEGQVLKQTEKAFDAAKGLLTNAQTALEKEQTLRALNGFAQELGAAALDEVAHLAASLLREETRLSTLLEAHRALRNGETDRAATALATVRDENDPYWLQLHAFWLLQIGDNSAATDDLLQASKLCPRPALLHRAAAMAYEQGRLPEAVEALQMILTLHDDIAAYQNLATIYVQQGDYAHAATQFARLRKCEPADPSHAINEAESRARAGDGEGSLRVYEALCTGERPPLIAILKRTALLEVLGRPKEAFTALIAWRLEYWDDPDYVGTLLRTAFAADEEATGHEALTRLKDLQRMGKVDPDRLQEKTVDDFVSQFREFHEQEQEVHRLTLQGRLPWVLADAALGRAGYRGWAFRTQPLIVLSEEPAEWARFTVYSTNGFHGLTSPPRRRDAKEGASSLQRLACPPTGTPVVIDLTSLYTLHRLGILPQATAYFGKMLYPYDYLQLVLGEAGKLMFHQLSQKTVAEQIKAALDAQQIVTAASPQTDNPQAEPTIAVREYVLDPDDDHSYKIRDVASALHQAGLISDAAREKAFPRETKLPARTTSSSIYSPTSPNGASEMPPLCLGQTLLVELSTLKTLTQYGLLPPLLRGFHVEISTQDRHQALSEARAVILQQQILQWHRELWEFVRQQPEFAPIPREMPQNGPDDPERQTSEHTLRDVSLDAMQLAERLQIPLLADDRVSQILILNARRASPEAAFGTHHLIGALHKDGRLTDEQLADAILTLMRWRYRFFVPDVGVLKTLLVRHLSHPPGSELQEVAVYVHDCLRDPGLFAGFEPTEPPATMANRLYQEWCTVIAEFIMSCWADEHFSDDAACAVTRWAVREMLPSPPLTTGPNSHFLPARSATFVLTHAILCSVGLRVCKESLC